MRLRFEGEGGTADPSVVTKNNKKVLSRLFSFYLYVVIPVYGRAIVAHSAVTLVGNVTHETQTNNQSIIHLNLVQTNTCI